MASHGFLSYQTVHLIVLYKNPNVRPPIRVWLCTTIDGIWKEIHKMVRACLTLTSHIKAPRIYEIWILFPIKVEYRDLINLWRFDCILIMDSSTLRDFLALQDLTISREAFYVRLFTIIDACNYMSKKQLYRDKRV